MLLSELRAAQPGDQLEAAVTRGRSLDLEVVVREILDEEASP
jgi:hypothetical protein